MDTAEPRGAPARAGAGVDERVLVLAPLGRDAELASAILAEGGLTAAVCADMRELCRALAEGAGAVLVAEEALSGDATAELREGLAAQPPWSDVPLLVCTGGEVSAAAARGSLAAVQGLGNVTLVDRPVRLVTLMSVLTVALRARRRQYQVRDLLAQLERGVTQRDRFLAMLGHELRNPLTAITYALRLLDRSGGDAERAARHREVLARQTHHLTRLVDDLLDVARVTLNKIVLNRSIVDLGALVARAVASFEPQANERGVGLSVSQAAPGAHVLADPVRLEQVLDNLLTNALKYTPGGGRVEVGLAREGAELVLRVADDGSGIAPEVLPFVFDLFSQADRTLHRSHGGLGIGLTMVESLIRLHGGSVRAHSAGVGRGTELVVRLPEVAVTEGDPVGAPATEAPPTAPSRVLVIEDNHDIRRGLVDILTAEGHTTDAAEDGPEGIARALANRPEIVLVDIGLPILDGYEVARAIRSALGDRTTLVAITGYGQPQDRERALAVGFDAHMTKPVRVEALNELLRSRAR